MADYDADTQPWAAFKSDITTVIIEDGVTAIGSNAFNGCTGLTRAYFLPTAVPTMVSNVFDGCTALTAIIVPAKVRDSYWSDWYGKNHYPYADDRVTEGYTVTCASGITVTTQHNGPMVQSEEVVTINYTIPDAAPEGYEAPFLGYQVKGYKINQTVTEDAGAYTFQMPHCYVTVMPAWTAKAWSGNGTKESPYIIEYASQLDLLSSNVNGLTDYTDYADTYFELGKDIEYSHITNWDDVASTENNYTPIGVYVTQDGKYYNSRIFKGHFDGKGHRIGGLRNYNETNSLYSCGYRGIFGKIGAAGSVSGVILDDTRITGFYIIGGIAGQNEGTISDCHVTDHVNIHINIGDNNATNFGGIAGQNDGTISGCTSAVSITSKIVQGSGISTPTSYHVGSIIGGIAGSNRSMLKDCLYLGTTLEGKEKIGAIAGGNTIGSTVQNCYDSSSALTITLGTNVALGGTATAYTVSGLTAYDSFVLTDGTTIYSAEGNTVTLAYTGSVPDGKIVLYSYNDGTDDNDVIGNTFQMPASNVTVAATFQTGYQRGAVTIIDKEDGKYAVIDGNYSGSDCTGVPSKVRVEQVAINRTFPTEGYCTIVLPFNVKTSSMEGVDSVLAFAGVDDKYVTYMQVVWEKSSEEVELQAYTPYLFKMKKSHLNIIGSVEFEPSRDAFIEVGDWEFRGLYYYTIWDQNHKDLGKVYGFAGSATDNISIGEFVRATAGAYIYPFRACLYHKDISSQAPHRASDLDGLPDRMPVRIIGKDGETTSLNEELRMKNEEFATAAGWYTLSGTRLVKQPTQKGIYIVNGKKVVVK